MFEVSPVMLLHMPRGLPGRKKLLRTTTRPSRHARVSHSGPTISVKRTRVGSAEGKPWTARRAAGLCFELRLPWLTTLYDTPRRRSGLKRPARTGASWSRKPWARMERRRVLEVEASGDLENHIQREGCRLLAVDARDRAIRDEQRDGASGAWWG